MENFLKIKDLKPEQIEELESFLSEMYIDLEGKADADLDDDRFVPNEAMRKKCKLDEIFNLRWC
jgi:hypothetical protein